MRTPSRSPKVRRAPRSIHHVFPYDPAQLGLTVRDWWEDQLAIWPIGAARRSQWWQRTTVHVIAGPGGEDLGDSHLQVSRARRSGPEHYFPGCDWSWELERRLRSLRPGDVCFVHASAHPGDSLAGVAARRAHVVAMHHVGDIGRRDGLKAVADYQVVLRTELVDHLVALGHPRERIGLVEPSVGPAFFVAPRGAGHVGPPRVGFIGRLTSIKGVDEIVPALQHLAGRGIRGELVLLGAGACEQVDAGGEAAGWSVRSLGQVPNSDVARHLAEWDVLFFPSRTEGFPRSVLEALAMGVPVVAVNGVLPSQLASRSGLHVCERRDLGAALLQVLQSPRPERAQLQAGVLAHDDAARELDLIVERAQRGAPNTAFRLAVSARIQRLRRDRRLRAGFSAVRKTSTWG